ncbi:hypothetical protein ACWGJ2_15215 [Streptomyces sp. NPDC054796]
MPSETPPDGFRFDVKAFCLLAGHPTRSEAAKILNHGFGDDSEDVEIPELPAEGEDG